MNDSAHALNSLISVRDLHFAYPSKTDLVSGPLSFAVQRGERCGLIAPVHAHRRTLFDLLAQGQQRWRGEIEVLGRALGQWGPDYFDRLGFAFARAGNYPKLTARENLEHFASLSQLRSEDLEKLLSAVQLSQKSELPVLELSGAEQQRLSWARSLLHDPDLWLVDTPETPLDALSLDVLNSLLTKRQAQGRTALVFLPQVQGALDLERCIILAKASAEASQSDPKRQRAA